MGNLPNPATTKELLCWLAAHEGVSVEAYYTPRPGLRCSHFLIGAEWQVYDEGIDGEPRKLTFTEFQEAYGNVRWQITEVNGEPAPVYPEPMVVPIQPGETISIYTLQLAMAGDTRKGDENARHCDEISEMLRAWQYAADVALRDWRHINPPVVVTANGAPPIEEGAIFPDTAVTFHPDACAFTNPAQALARAQRKTATATEYLAVCIEDGQAVELRPRVPAKDVLRLLAQWAEEPDFADDRPVTEEYVACTAGMTRDAYAFRLAPAETSAPPEPVLLWCKQCGAVSRATHAPCCEVHGYACPECGSDADSVRVYSVAEAQSIAAGSSRLVAPFAAVLAQITAPEPTKDALVEPDYLVAFLDGGVITDWQCLSAAEAQLAITDWTDNDAEQRPAPWGHCLVYSAESDSGDREAWAFPLDTPGMNAAFDQLAAELTNSSSAPEYVVAFLADGVVTDWQYLSAVEAQSAVASWTNDKVEQRSGPWDEALVYSASSADGDYDAWAFPLDYARQAAAQAAVASPAAPTAPADYIAVFLDGGVVKKWQYLASAGDAQSALADWAEDGAEPQYGPGDGAAVYSAESEAVNGRDAWAFPVNRPTPASYDVATVLAMRPDWDAATAARFLTDKARDLAASVEAALTELLTNELTQWENHPG